MKVVLLITLMFTLALVHGQNPVPCLPGRNRNAYNEFVRRHTIDDSFERNSLSYWRMHILLNNLCHRRRQTFVESSDLGRVQQICQGSGRRYNSYNNLCVSNSPIKVYDLTLDNNCQIQTFNSGERYVIVACDAINNVCLPVHFEGSTNRAPNTQFGCCDNGGLKLFFRDDL